MSAAQQVAILIPIAYLAGSIPFGLIVGRAKGIDPRTAGSGNIGATNLGRLLGMRYFWLVFVLDLLKSLLPMLAATLLLYRASDGISHLADTWHTSLLWLCVGLAAILGHMFSLFLKFKGGKGVATSAGVMLGLFPYYTFPAIAAISIFILVFATWRYISLASITGVAAFPLAYVAIGLWRNWPLTSAQLPLLIAAILMAVLIIYRHRSNIARLRAGTESRFARAAGTETMR